jgi:hypothetical protein
MLTLRTVILAQHRTWLFKGVATMSDWQIKRASIAALLARLHAISVSSAEEDRVEAQAIEREIAIRLECGDV